MKVKALLSFVGRISMDINEEREIIDKELAKDLIQAGYVVEIKNNSNLSIGPTSNDKEKSKGKKKK